MAMSNIAINDGKTTPLSHAFTPVNPQSGSTPARWANKVTGFSSQAWEWLSTLVAPAKKKGQLHRYNLTIKLPVVTMVDGAEVLHGEVSGYATILAPFGLDTTDRVKDVFALLRNGLSNTQVENVLRDMNPSI